MDENIEGIVDDIVGEIAMVDVLENGITIVTDPLEIDFVDEATDLIKWSILDNTPRATIEIENNVNYGYNIQSVHQPYNIGNTLEFKDDINPPNERAVLVSWDNDGIMTWKVKGVFLVLFHVYGQGSLEGDDAFDYFMGLTFAGRTYQFSSAISHANAYYSMNTEHSAVSGFTIVSRNINDTDSFQLTQQAGADFAGISLAHQIYVIRIM